MSDVRKGQYPGKLSRNDFRSQALDEKDKFTHRFDKPGTYKYLCSIHPKMVGTITVVAK